MAKNLKHLDNYVSNNRFAEMHFTIGHAFYVFPDIYIICLLLNGFSMLLHGKLTTTVTSYLSFNRLSNIKLLNKRQL